jgi:hypothetical protein
VPDSQPIIQATATLWRDVLLVWVPVLVALIGAAALIANTNRQLRHASRLQRERALKQAIAGFGSAIYRFVEAQQRYAKELEAANYDREDVEPETAAAMDDSAAAVITAALLAQTEATSKPLVERLRAITKRAYVSTHSEHLVGEGKSKKQAFEEAHKHIRLANLDVQKLIDDLDRYV